MKLRKNKWDRVILGDVCEINPSNREITDIPNDTIVSFAEMADLNEKSRNSIIHRKKQLKSSRKKED